MKWRMDDGGEMSLKSNEKSKKNVDIRSKKNEHLVEIHKPLKNNAFYIHL